MTIEEEFFKCFGIEPIAIKYECRCGTNTIQCNVETCKSKICDKTHCCDQKQVGVYYPPITDRILLELICIIIRDKANYNLHLSTIKNVKDLKNEILNQCMKNRALIKHQVQPLFKE